MADTIVVTAKGLSSWCDGITTPIVTMDLGVLPAGTHQVEVWSGADSVTHTFAVGASAGTIVFVGYGQIQVMDPDGTNRFRLSNVSFQVADPSLSPDGSQVVFGGRPDGDWEILVMDADGANVIQLTDNSATECCPSWSPDGLRIAYTSDADGDNEIYTMDADGTSVVQLTSNSVADEYASWSPDGARIVFQSTRSGSDQIHVMDADGGNVVQLTNNSPSIDGPPSWSPDGSRITFSALDNIHVMDADGSNVVQLTSFTGGFGGGASSPCWSPDGSRMAYSGYHPMPEGNSYIHVHDSDGTNGVVLWWEDSWVQRDRDPSWSAVGRFLEAPELGPIGDRAVAVGSTLAFELSATDGDGDVLSLSVSGNPVGSSLTGDVFTWAPTADQVGEHVVTFTVDDGRGETDSEAITIAVGEAPPTIVEIPLVAGFNRVGYLPTFYDSTRHALDSILDNMKQILGYERPGGLEPNGRNGATKFNPSEWVDETWGDFFTSMKRMGPRQGYWIEMNAPDTLVYPSSPAPGTPQTPVGKMVATASVRDGQVHPTMWWMGMHGWLTTTGGDPAPAGTVVDVIDGQGNTAGWFEVEHLGGYGYMPIYLDDPATDLDEGADEGEWLTVRVNGDATQYRVQWTEFGDEVRLDMEIGRQASSPSPLPTTYALGSNYPNPFNSTTTIAYELPSEQEVVLLIWNLAGQRARELVHTRQAAGSYSVTWDGRDGTGSPVANGVYLYEIRAGDFQMARKMVLMK